MTILIFEYFQVGFGLLHFIHFHGHIGIIFYSYGLFSILKWVLLKRGIGVGWGALWVDMKVGKAFEVDHSASKHGFVAVYFVIYCT